jgi:hypothetical protein
VISLVPEVSISIFADDSSIIICNNFDYLCTLANCVLSHLSKWFAANELAVRLDETKIMKFVTNNALQCALSIGHNGTYTDKSANTKFLRLQIDNQINCKNNFDQ